MSAEHTPGPWKANREGDGHCFVGDGMWFANVSWTVSGPRNDADARLIAAAPDLLQSAKRALGIVAFHAGTTDKVVSSLTALNIHAELLAAISKAEGQS